MIAKRVWRILFLLSAVVAVVCVILLLNFTASNPTGRRYSSAEPSATGDDIGVSGRAGIEAEDILSKDLGIARNSVPYQQLCVCPLSKDVPSLCGNCLIHTQLPDGKHYMTPDFIGNDFIVEAKHTKSLTSSNLTQLTVYATAAHEKKRKLWLFVDIGAEVDPRYFDLVESTGGDVVYYFTVPGYVDPVDRAAWIGLAISAATGCGAALLEMRSRRRSVRVVIWRSRPKPPPPTPVDEAEAFRDRIRARAQQVIDRDGR